MGFSDFMSMGIEEMSGGVLGGVLKGFAEGWLKWLVKGEHGISVWGIDESHSLSALESYASRTLNYWRLRQRCTRADETSGACPCP